MNTTAQQLIEKVENKVSSYYIGDFSNSVSIGGKNEL